MKHFIAEVGYKNNDRVSKIIVKAETFFVAIEKIRDRIGRDFRCVVEDAYPRTVLKISGMELYLVMSDLPTEVIE